MFLGLKKMHTLKSKTKQGMVFRMIRIKDSLLPMGKVWSWDSLIIHKDICFFSKTMWKNGIRLAHDVFFFANVEGQSTRIWQGSLYDTPPQTSCTFTRKKLKKSDRFASNLIPPNLDPWGIPQDPTPPPHIAQSFLGLKGAGNKIEVLMPRRCCFFSGVKTCLPRSLLTWWSRIIQIHPPQNVRL